MKTLLTTTAAAVLFSTTAFAGSPLDSDTSYGSVLFDLGAGSSGASYSEPQGVVADALYSSDNFGSVLFDLDRTSHEHVLATPPAVGDSADDYGSVLYDLGARY